VGGGAAAGIRGGLPGILGLIVECSCHSCSMKVPQELSETAA
jgi:hypothetical protein